MRRQRQPPHQSHVSPLRPPRGQGRGAEAPPAAMAIATAIAALPTARDQDTRDEAQLVPQLEALLRLLPTFAERAALRMLPSHPLDPGDPSSSSSSSPSSRNTRAATASRLAEFGDGVVPNAGEVVDAAGRIGLFALDALTPWDYDRHDFGVTFTHTWEESEFLPRVWRRVAGGSGSGSNSNSNSSSRNSKGNRSGSDRGSASGNGRVRTETAGATEAAMSLVPTKVKVTSTMKPVEGEWKVTGRSTLWQSGDGDGVVFGKAGMFLAGKGVPYIGVEADRVWALPQRGGGSSRRTKLFGNVNYRSSRAPQKDPVRASFGLQHDFALGRGLHITLRVGVHPLEKRKVFATPVPNGQYY